MISLTNEETRGFFANCKICSKFELSNSWIEELLVKSIFTSILLLDFTVRRNSIDVSRWTDIDQYQIEEERKNEVHFLFMFLWNDTLYLMNYQQLNSN